MLSYMMKRIGMIIPVLLGMVLIVFAIVRAIPGNPAEVILGQNATKESISRLTIQLGLDQPWYQQYVKYLWNLLHGDLGISLRTNSPINAEIWPYLAATIELTFCAMVIAVIVGINAGTISAWFQKTWFDYTAMIIALIGISIPVFWLGLMEQWFFSIHLQLLPTSGREDVRLPVNPITHLYLLDTLLQGEFSQFRTVVLHLLLPSLALSTIPTAIIARITRSSMLESLRSDFVRTSRAKGLNMFTVVYKHGLKNAIIPILTVIGLQTGTMLGGAILTETIFGWPGIGSYIFQAINYRDYPAIQSGILIIASMFILINFIVDLLYAKIDPRIKYN